MDIDTQQGKILTDKNAYENYIRNILLTPVGEVPSNRAFGSYLEKYLFEPYDFRIKQLINMEVKRALMRWLKNVKINKIENEIDPNNQRLVVFVSLTAKGLTEDNVIETEAIFDITKGEK